MVIESSMHDKFSKKLSEIIDANLHDEKFGVNDLAAELGMSRVTLHRRAKQIFEKPVSEIIRETRLKRAAGMLQQKSGTVSEIAFQVGFSSVSYFNHCFHEHFGYPPGEVLKGLRQPIAPENTEQEIEKPKKSYRLLIPYFLGVVVILLGVYFINFSKAKSKPPVSEKSIVFLFPVYNSNDSTNLYQVNGTVEAVLNQLSLIGDLTVYPWSSAIKYKNSNLSGKDIAREINANYIVESSSAEYSGILRVNFKLINALTGKQIWYKPYDINPKDIIRLPLEISQNIANEIQALITPVEQEKINRPPTENYVAYNYYTQAIEQREKNLENTAEAIQLLEKALENDNEFALAYAELAISYYILNLWEGEDNYWNEIESYADKAMLYDPQRDMCLIAKAYDYINKGENKQAIPFLEKAIEYNPNSAVSYRLLANLYNLSRGANTEKYLEYKLKAIKLNNTVLDSIKESEDYRLAARALRVAGFYDEAERYIDRSLELNPSNPSSYCEKGDILIERNKDYSNARTILFEGLQKDSSNVEILRSVFTNYFLTRDFVNANVFYQKINHIDTFSSIWVGKDFSRLSVMFEKLGMENEAKEAFNYFKNTDRSASNSYVLSTELARLYSLENNKQKAFEQLNIFSHQNSFFRYSIRMLIDDAVYDNIRNEPDFIKIYNKIDTKFWKDHERIQKVLEEKGLI